MRKCFFCSKTADSVEDAWPHWLTNQFRTPQSSEIKAERHGVKLDPWRVYQPEMRIRCVCHSCNNGWMSQLECQAKQFLQPMLQGKNSILSMESQSIITLWGVKTAMVFEGLDQPNLRAYTQSEHEQLRTLSAIPWRTSVWTAFSVDPSYFMSMKNRHMNPVEAGNISGVSITMAFAHVVLQVLTIRIPKDVEPATRVTTNVIKGSWEKATVQIWPIRSSTVSWPPSIGLNGEKGLNSFSERFNTSTIDSNRLERIQI